MYVILKTFFVHVIQCSCSRAVGYRFGPHLSDTVPLLINYCSSASESDEELREYSLQVLVFCQFLFHFSSNISFSCSNCFAIVFFFCRH